MFSKLTIAFVLLNISASFGIQIPHMINKNLVMAQTDNSTNNATAEAPAGVTVGEASYFADLFSRFYQEECLTEYPENYTTTYNHDNTTGAVTMCMDFKDDCDLPVVECFTFSNTSVGYSNTVGDGSELSLDTLYSLAVDNASSTTVTVSVGSFRVSTFNIPVDAFHSIVKKLEDHEEAHEGDDDEGDYEDDDSNDGSY